MGTLRNWIADNRGIATIEYSLLAGFIALGVVTSLGELGNSVADTFDKIYSEWTDAQGGNGKGKGNGHGNGNGNGNGNVNGNGKGKGKP